MHLAVGKELRSGDLVVSLGAGDIHEEATLLVRDLEMLDRLRQEMGPGVAKLYEPLAGHTTLRVGGPAQYWLEPETEEGLGRLIRFCREKNIPLLVLGRGSNLLVRDGGVAGAVVHLERGEFGTFSVSGRELRAGAGVKLKQLSHAAKAAGIGGFEWMEGIPGSVGGGLRMNAGAMGAETFDQVVSVRYFDTEGVAHEASPATMDVKYRSVPALAKNVAVSATFKGCERTREEIERLHEESTQKRRSTQPVASSAGCIFKNPVECPAGKLVDQLGLKDYKIGKARVSKAHGNFIVNDGGATSGDILTLIGTIQERALQERGIRLETEVQIIGKEEGVL